METFQTCEDCFAALDLWQKKIYVGLRLGPWAIVLCRVAQYMGRKHQRSLGYGNLP